MVRLYISMIVCSYLAIYLSLCQANCSAPFIHNCFSLSKATNLSSFIYSTIDPSTPCYFSLFVPHYVSPLMA